MRHKNLLRIGLAVVALALVCSAAPSHGEKPKEPAKEPKLDDRELSLAKTVLEAGEKERLAYLQELGVERRRLRHESSSKARALGAVLTTIREAKGLYMPTLMPRAGSVGVFRDAHHPLRERPLEIFQVLADDNVLVRPLNTDELLWLHGFKIDSPVDGEVITIRRLVYVSGNKRYTTVAGSSRTVLVAEPLDIDEKVWIKAAEELKLRKPKR